MSVCPWALQSSFARVPQRQHAACFLHYSTGSHKCFGFFLYSHHVLCLDLDPLAGKDINRESKQNRFAAFLVDTQLQERRSGWTEGTKMVISSAPWRGHCTRDLGP